MQPNGMQWDAPFGGSLPLDDGSQSVPCKKWVGICLTGCAGHKEMDCDCQSCDSWCFFKKKYNFKTAGQLGTELQSTIYFKLANNCQSNELKNSKYGQKRGKK